MSIKVITISRQFGSGGRTVAKLVADKLGWAYYDKELVKKIAAESGLAESYVLDSGEYACSTNSFLFNWAMSAESGRNPGTLPVSDQLYIVQNNVIRDLADKGSCVIVGRCADYILRDHTDVLNVFVHADAEFRADRIVRLYGETLDKPAKRLKEKDDKRRTYYRHYTGRVWGAASNYDVTLDSGRIGVEHCADIVVGIAAELNKRDGKSRPPGRLFFFASCPCGFAAGACAVQNAS